MKKIMTVLAAVSIFLGAMVSVSAATLCRTSGGNGAVKLTINLNDGYAGALDATLKLSGKVTLDTIEWDASLAPEYVKKYTYDKNTNTVRLYIATGDASKNLSDKDGNVAIGVVKVKAAADKEKFNVEINRLSVTNMDYKVRNITTLENDKTADFTYKLEDLNDNDDSNDNNDNNGGNNNGDKPGTGENDNNSGAGDDNNQNGTGNNNGDSNINNPAPTPDNKKDEAIKNNLGNKGTYESTNTGSDIDMSVYLNLSLSMLLILGAAGYIVYRKKQKV